MTELSILRRATSRQTSATNLVKAGAAAFSLLFGLGSIPASAQQDVPADVPVEIETVEAPIAPPAPTGAEITLEATVDAMVAEHIRNSHIPGLTMSVVRDGEILLAEGFGYADLEDQIPVDPEYHLFRLGSISKTYTFLALMQLVEEGRVELDADVNTYLEDYEIPEAFGKPVTIRDLFTHRPGFEDVYRDFWFDAETEAERMAELQLHDWLADNIPRQPMPPGEYVSYSNYGAALAGDIIATVTGIPYETYIENEILEPLGLSSTTPRQLLPDGYDRAMSPELGQRLVSFYSSNGGVATEMSFELIPMAPAGSFSASATDMASYMIALMNPEAMDDADVLNDDTVLQLIQRPYPSNPDAPAYTYGFRSGDIGGYSTMEHGGATMTSFSTLVMIPELDMGVFVAVNGGTDALAPYTIAHTLLADLIGDAARPPLTTSTLSEDALSEYAGGYLSSRRIWGGVLKLAGASEVYSVSPLANGHLRIDGGEYAYASNDLFINVWDDERVQFLRNDDGVVEGFQSTYGHTTLLRVEPEDDINLLLLASALAFFFALTQIISAWKRISDNRRPALSGHALLLWSFLTSVWTMVVFVSFGLFMMDILAAGNEIIKIWPTGSLTWLLTSIIILIIMTVVLVLGLIPLFGKSRLTFFRKLHYLLFVGALVYFLFKLNEWHFVGYNYW